MPLHDPLVHLAISQGRQETFISSLWEFKKPYRLRDIKPGDKVKRSVKYAICWPGVKS